jgi:pimeloyl-ACP methyl ester carboxylesterase
VLAANLGSRFGPDVIFAAATGLPDVVAEAFRRPEPVQAETPFAQPWPLDAWPDVPTRFVLCRHDRFFPADFMRHVVHERLGIEPDELASGHLPALSQPAVLVRLLERFRVSVSA